MIEFFNNKYEIIKGNEYFDKELVDSLLTDYFEPYDYILGDYAYDGGDGIKLLDWLAVNERFYPIRLHTMNPVGRENMLRMIQRYW